MLLLLVHAFGVVHMGLYMDWCMGCGGGICHCVRMCVCVCVCMFKLLTVCRLGGLTGHTCLVCAGVSMG